MSISKTDWDALHARASQLIPRGAADRLFYDLPELDEAVRSFLTKLELLNGAFETVDQDSTRLWHAAYGLRSELSHMAFHVHSAETLLDLLMDAARNLPPLNELTDKEINKLESTAMHADIDGTGNSR